MYIGIEEVFMVGMTFAFGTVVWAYAKVKSQFESEGSIPLRISDLDELDKLNQTYVRKDDCDVIEQAGEDISKLELALNRLPKKIAKLTEGQQHQTEVLLQTLLGAEQKFQENLLKLSASIVEVESLLGLVEEICKEKEVNE